jgi:hypothetical protein
MPELFIERGRLRILDGSESLALVDNRGRDWSPGREEILGVRALEGGGYALLLQGGTAARPQFSELGVSAGGEVERRAVALNDTGVIAAETAYGRDLNGDGVIGFALVGDVLAARDGVAVGLVSGGTLGLILEGDGDAPDRVLPIVTDRGAGLTLARNESVSQVVATEGGFVVILRQESGSRVTFSELVLDGGGVQQGRATRLSDAALAEAEARLGVDLDGDGLIGSRVVDPAALTTVAELEGLRLVATQGGGFALLPDGADEVLVLTQGVRGWSPGSAEVVGVRAAGDGGSTVLLQRGSPTAPSFLEQAFDGAGAAVGAAVRLSAVEVIGRELTYGRDLDGNGTIGLAVTATLAEIDGVALVAAAGGLFGVQRDGEVTVLVLPNGRPWSLPEGGVVRALAPGEDGRLEVLIEQTATGRFLEAGIGVGGVVSVTRGRPVAELETAFDLDLDNDGRIGDAVEARLDSTLRVGEAEVALYAAASGTFHVSVGAPLEVDDALGDATTMLRDKAGNPWAPGAFLSALGAAPVAARLTDGGIAVILQADLGATVWSYEKLFTAQGIAVGGAASLSQAALAARERLHLQDLDGNGVIALQGEEVTVGEARLSALAEAVQGVPRFDGAGAVRVVDVADTADLRLIVSSGVAVSVAAADGAVTRVSREPVAENPALTQITLTGFAGLQDAIDDPATAAGDELVVGAGTHAGDVRIDQPGLVLSGAQAGVAAWQPGDGAAVQRDGAESVIAGKVTVTAAGVGTVIDGFTMTGRAGWDGVSLDIARGGEDITILNNVIETYAAVGGYAKAGHVALDAASVVFSGNKVAAAPDFGSFAGRPDDPLADARGVNAVAVNPGEAATVLIEGNWISGASGGGVGITPSGATVTVSGNRIETVGEGAFGFGSDFGELTFVGNTILDYVRNGIFLPGVGEAPQGTARIYDNVLAGPRPVTLDPNAPVATDAEATPGPIDLAALLAANTIEAGVLLLSGGSIAAFSGVQAAIDAASANDTILVAAGRYEESLTVNKAGLTILGPNAGVAGTSADRRPEAVIEGGGKITVTAPGVVLDGLSIALQAAGNTPPLDIRGQDVTLANNLIASALYQKASGLTYTGNLVSDFGATASGYAQNAIVSDSRNGLLEDWTITDNVFDGVARGLVLAASGPAGTTYRDITISGNEFRDIPNRGVQVGDNAVIEGDFTVTGNLFDGSGIGLAIRAPAVVDPAAVITVDGNVFRNLDAGFWAGTPAALLGFEPLANSFENVASDVLITGTGGPDILTGTSASDRFLGGAGADTFVFVGDRIGNDVIADFDGDRIDLSGYVGLSFGDLEIAEVDGASVITAEAFDGSITVLATTGLSPDDFLFGALGG